MAASESECLAITVIENGDSNGVINDGNEKGCDPIKPINQISVGQELNLGIVNQYGQLMGDYSKLDDELWLPKSEEDDDAVEMCNDGLQLDIVTPHEKMIDLNRPLAFDFEPVSEYVDYPAPDGCIAPATVINFSAKDSSENPSETPSPVSVLKRKRSYSNGTGTMCSQNKYRQADQSESEFSMESSLSDEIDEPTPLQKVRTRRISDLLDLNHSNQATKKCLHCETTETPQWRTGPMGRKTLCNACGVQYKHGRLFADYRPLRSPTFDPSLHFSLPKKVQELRMGYTSERVPNVGFKTKKVKEVKKGNDTHENDPDFTPKPKKVKEMKMGKRFVRVPYHTLNPNKVQKQRMDNTCERDLNPTPKPKNAEEMRMNNDSDTGPNFAAEARRPEEIGNVGQNLVSGQESVDEMSWGNNNEKEQNRAHIAKKFYNSTERASDGHTLSSYGRNYKFVSGPILPRKQKVARKCTHCASTETPQWREGPMGRFTLCNACGVQYRNGRLFPEYRPLKSPTYDPLLHSHLPKRVLEMRMRIAEKSATSGNSQDPA